jgi:signal transduction histidine kinase
MRSLRSRLILGAALVALVPLAVTTIALSRRIETMVRAQAAQRLTTALSSLESDLAADERGIQEKLGILARDPNLRRLYLVRPAGTRDLSEYLAERTKLLGLDFLEVADSTGNVVAGESASASAPNLALAATAPIRYESTPVGTLRGGLALDRAFLQRLERTSGIDLALVDGNGHTVASTDSSRFANAALPPTDAVQRISIGDASYLTRSFPLNLAAPPPHMVGFISTASADRTIAGLQLTALLVGLLGLGLAILLGGIWSSQISRPVERLAEFSSRVAEGNWEEPLALRSVKELETLVTALDRMRRDLRAYRERLIQSERHAAWSQMARKVAHEVKNPLTPIAISVADLKRSYDQKREDFPLILDQAVRTIGEEVDRLKHMLQEFSEFGRLPPPRFESCRVAQLFEDLGTLYAGEVSRGRLVLGTSGAAAATNATFDADPAQMRQALVNLLQNALEAMNANGRVQVSARATENEIEISVSDQGPGFTEEQQRRLFEPGFTTKAGGSGLGLVMVERIVADHRGTIDVSSRPGSGTTFTLRLPRAHRA